MRKYLYWGFVFLLLYIALDETARYAWRKVMLDTYSTVKRDSTMWFEGVPMQTAKTESNHFYPLR